MQGRAVTYFNVEPLPWGTCAVRMHEEGDEKVKARFLVAPSLTGREITVMMMGGEPMGEKLPSMAQFIAGANEHFPAARKAVWYRRQPDGSFVRREMKLTGKPWWHRFLIDIGKALRAYYGVR